MPNASIGGLVSGLDTATIISQLMQLEAQPQTRLRVKVGTEQSALSSLQALNTKLASLTTKAADLAKVSGWSPSTATSSSEHVTVQADAGATATSLSFTVQSLATRSQQAYETTALAATAGTGTAGEVTVSYADGSTETLDFGDGSLRAIAAAINSDSDKLSAALVRVGTEAGEPVYRLSVSARSTGAGTGFIIGDPGFLGGVRAGAVSGQDAAILLPGETAPLTSATNTFTDLMPGVDVTLGGAATGTVTVDIARDTAGLKTRVQDLVDSLNTALADLATMTATSVSGKAGSLAGNATLRDVRNQLLSLVSGGVDGKSLASVGVQTTRDGKLEFDAEAFSAAMTADPAAVTDLFAPTGATDGGFASGLETLGKKLSNSVDGTVTGLINGRTETIDGLNDAIDTWDVRLELRRQTLERTYGALEVALGKLQSQSSWLAGQINSLPTMSSGS